MFDDDGIERVGMSVFIQGLTPEQLAIFVEDAQKKLSYWMKLAKLRDETGLPVDIIYLNLKGSKRLPEVVSDGVTRPVTNEEFELGMRFCIQIHQCGGLEAVLKWLRERHNV